MSTLIPNQNTWVGFSPTPPVAIATLIPTVAEVAAATVLTSFLISLTAAASGNSIPIPNLSTLFEPSIPGTSTASFTAELYRDSVLASDTAWSLLPRNAAGYFYISRFGGLGTNKLPILGDTVEVWPVRVSARTASAMTSNTAQTFTLTCAVPAVPNEAAVIAA